MHILPPINAAWKYVQWHLSASLCSVWAITFECLDLQCFW